MSLLLDKPEISVIMPAYNEAGNISDVITNACLVLNTFTNNYELIIVNDGSTDDTNEIVKKSSLSNPHIRLIQHHQNRGYGAAIRSGLKESKFDYIFITDSDGQFDISELPDIFVQLVKADFIQGFRINRQDNLQRKLNTFLWNLLCKALFKTGMRDVDCAFKLFKSKILESISLKANGAMISTELIIKAKKAGFKLIEIGVHHFPRKSGKPTGANINVILKALKEIVRLYPELK